MRCRCKNGLHKIEGDEYRRRGACCVEGQVTTGCTCTSCSRLRQDRMTYKQWIRSGDYGLGRRPSRRKASSDE